MKKLIILMGMILLCFFLAEKSIAQFGNIAKKDLAYLHKLNDSLGKEGARVLDEIFPSERLRADSLFTRQLVRGMLVPYSIYYPFDSITTAPILYPPDSSFRIITWHYTINDADYRQKGVLQINTKDGSPKFFPLFDASEYTNEPMDSIRDSRNWIGAIYYRILQHEWRGQKIYTLIGYDENNSITTRKWLDILTFAPDGTPRFGGNYFRVPYDSVFTPGAQRYLMEYKAGARARLNYDDEEGMIIMDYLISQTGEREKRYTLVPGGDYSGLKWKNGAWEYIDRLDVEMRGDGNEPRPALILNDDGTSNEDQLQKQSDKNMKQKEAVEKTGTKKSKKGK
jgi:hypothetical protein